MSPRRTLWALGWAITAMAIAAILLDFISPWFRVGLVLTAVSSTRAYFHGRLADAYGSAAESLTSAADTIERQQAAHEQDVAVITAAKHYIDCLEQRAKQRGDGDRKLSS
jgi:hypothetical protein